MSALVPQVHLLICFDQRIKPGVVLQSLDILRSKQWQNETILVCDESWKPYVNIDQAVIFVDQKNFVQGANRAIGIDKLEEILDQLDNFEIVEVTQIGDLNWGRWIAGYFDDNPQITKNFVNWEASELSSVEIINDIARELAIDPTLPRSEKIKSQSVYIDPYINNELTAEFLEMIDRIDPKYWPSWLQIIVQEKDAKILKDKNFSDHLVDLTDSEACLFNQSILCFSQNSKFFQTSRSYNVALVGADRGDSLFLQGDICIQFSEPSHPLELFNILAYWKSNRLRELAFQWMNMGIDVWIVESHLNRITCRSLLNYSSDLFHAQNLVSEYLRKGESINKYDLHDLVLTLRKGYNNDPYALSFSIKLLLMIIDRMISSAKCGERLFQRLGSDYHRIIIGEAFMEGLIQNHAKNLKDLDVVSHLAQFRKFLVKIDIYNDENDHQRKYRESR